MKLSKNLKNLIKIALSVIILTILIYKTKIDFRHIFSSVKSPRFLLFSFFFPVIIVPFVSNNRLKAFLKVQGIQDRFFSLLRLTFISYFLGVLMPSANGADAIRMYLVEKRHSKSIGKGSAAVIIDRLIGLYILSIMSNIGAICSLRSGLPIGVFYLTLFTTTILTLLIVLIRVPILFRLVTNISIMRKKNKVVVYLNEVVNSLHYFPIKRVFLTSLSLITLMQMASFVFVFCLYNALGVDVPFYYHIVFCPLIFIVSAIPISIGGFGIRESGFVYFYKFAGVSGDISLIVSLLYYMITASFPIFMGMILYLIGERKGSIPQAKSVSQDI